MTDLYHSVSFVENQEPLAEEKRVVSAVLSVAPWLTFKYGHYCRL